MFDLTRQEQYVLLILAIIIFVGAVLEYSFKKYPQLKNIINVVETDQLYPKMDINTASREELVNLPYIGNYTALEIVKYRDIHGPFTSLDQLKKVKGIRDKNYQRFKDFVKIEP